MIITLKKTNFTFQTIKILFQQIIFYPWGSLWFILSEIIAIIILYFFIKKDKIATAITMGCILLPICLLGDTYSFLLKDNYIQSIMNTYLKIALSTRNGLFAGFPLFTVGFVISYKEKKIYNTNIIKNIILLFVVTVIGIYEATKIRYLSSHYSFLITGVITAVLLVIISITARSINIKINTCLLRNLSTSIYFMHRPIIYYLSLIGIKMSSKELFFYTIFLIIILCYPLYKLNNKFINRIIK